VHVAVRPSILKSQLQLLKHRRPAGRVERTTVEASVPMLLGCTRHMRRTGRARRARRRPRRQRTAGHQAIERAGAPAGSVSVHSAHGHGGAPAPRAHGLGPGGWGMGAAAIGSGRCAPACAAQPRATLHVHGPRGRAQNYYPDRAARGTDTDGGFCFYYRISQQRVRSVIQKPTCP
jgi:hypothetical protein